MKKLVAGGLFGVLVLVWLVGVIGGPQPNPPAVAAPTRVAVAPTIAVVAPAATVRPTAVPSAPTPRPTAAPAPTALPTAMTLAPPLITQVVLGPVAPPSYELAKVDQRGGKSDQYAVVKLRAPIPLDREQVMGVLADGVERALRAPNAPRALQVWLYSWGATLSESADLGEAFASRDGLGLSGNGTWPSSWIYGLAAKPMFEAEFFRDTGKVFLALPVMELRNGSRVATNMERFEIQR